MIKCITLCTKLIAASLAALLFASCHAKIDLGNGIDGNGKVTTQTRNVENNFSKIDVSRGLNVTLEQSSNYAVTVEADENLQDHIAVRVENGTLIISSDNNIDEASAKNIHVKLPALTAIVADSGSSISNHNVFTGTDIWVKTDSGSSADLNLEFDNIKTEADSGSSLDLKGKALVLKATTDSGSSVDASDLLVNDVTADAGSGSNLTVHPIVNLKAKASSGSAINYKGNPKNVSKEESSGGSVSKE